MTNVTADSCVANQHDATQSTLRTETGGMRWKLTLAQPAQPELGPDVESLLVELEPLPDDAGVRVTYRDAASERWEVPKRLLGPCAADEQEFLPPTGASAQARGAC